jgi:type II secretory pathway predicted ATPase ExeA/nucleoid-associated protein YgaU
MGKTSLLFRLMQNLEPTARTVFLFQTQCDSREFLKYLLTDMGIQTDSSDLVKMHSQLNETLAENAKTGKQLVIIVDEAQNLEPSVLETIRLLSDFETSRQKLIQIILAGQLQLADKLASPSLVQLSQRISILSRLKPFSREETSAYINHRLSVAGHSGAPLFSAGAVDLIAELSEGIPRNINNLCFNALSMGYAIKQAEISADVIKEVAADLSIFYRPETATPPVAPLVVPDSLPLAVNVAAPIAAVVPVVPVTTGAPIAAKAGAEGKKSPVVTPAGIASGSHLGSGWASPVPGRVSHKGRNVALAGCVVVAAFLAGYGWQNYHRGAGARSGEVRAESMAAVASTKASPTVSPVTLTGGAVPGNNLPSSASPARSGKRVSAAHAAGRRGAAAGGPSGLPANVQSVLVKPNDTLWGLSQKYSSPSATADNFHSITSLNNLANPNHIEAGQRLLLPFQPASGANASTDSAPPATKPD